MRFLSSLIVLLCSIALLNSAKVSAQHYIGGQGDIVLPVPPLSNDYAAGWGVLFGYRNYSDDKPGFWDVMIGYQKIPPAYDSLVYLDSQGDTGTFSHSRRRIFPVHAGFCYKLANNKMPIGFKPYVGGSVGYNYNNWSYTDQNSTGSLGARETEGKGVLIPRVGFASLIADRLLLGVEVRYNFQFSIGSGSFEDINYNPNLGDWEHFVTVGASVMVRVK